MSILETIADWWKSEQPNWTLIPVPAPAVASARDALPAGQAVQEHQAYITVRMRSMAIAASRRGWNRFHAVLHADTSLLLRDGETAQIQNILAPDFFRDLDPKRIQQVLHIDRTIYGPVPYVGGALALRLGVFAVKHADLAATFLSFLEDLSAISGVAFMAPAKPYITPIKNGIELLTGTADATSLEIGLIREYEPPVTGWYALVRLPGGTVKSADLSVAQGNFELLHNGRSMPGVPYLLYSIDAATTRPDWSRIPELQSVYADFAKAGGVANDQRGARKAVDTFTRLVTISPELLRTHAIDVIRAVENEYNAVFPTNAPKRSGGRDIAPELRALEVRFSTPV